GDDSGRRNPDEDDQQGQRRDDRGLIGAGDEADAGEQHRGQQRHSDRPENGFEQFRAHWWPPFSRSRVSWLSTRASKSPRARISSWALGPSSRGSPRGPYSSTISSMISCRLRVSAAEVVITPMGSNRTHAMTPMSRA